MKKMKTLFSIMLAIVLAVGSIDLGVIGDISPEVHAANERTLVDLTGLVTGKETTHTHVWEQKYDSNYHWMQCIICNGIKDKVSHSFQSSWEYGTPSCAYYNYCHHMCNQCGYNYSTRLACYWPGSAPGPENWVQYGYNSSGLSCIGHVRRCRECGSVIDYDYYSYADGYKHHYNYAPNRGQTTDHSTPSGPAMNSYYEKCWYWKNGVKTEVKCGGGEQVCARCGLVYNGEHKYYKSINNTYTVNGINSHSTATIVCEMCDKPAYDVSVDATPQKISGTWWTYVTVKITKRYSNISYDHWSSSFAGTPYSNPADKTYSDFEILQQDANTFKYRIKHLTNTMPTGAYTWRQGYIYYFYDSSEPTRPLHSFHTWLGGTGGRVYGSYPEYDAPTNITVTPYPITYGKDGWVTSMRLRITGYENHSDFLNWTLYDQDGSKLDNGRVSIGGPGNFSFDIYPYVEADEYGRNLTVQIADAYGNAASKAMTLTKVDARYPTMTSATNFATGWCKYKDVSFTAKDNGIGSIRIAFNTEKEYKQAYGYKANLGRDYRFTGDVYGTVVGMVYMRDDLENVWPGYRVTLGYFDNTSPTLRVSQQELNEKAHFVVTADDYSSVVKKQGSGKTADAQGKYGFNYGYSRIDDVSTAKWSGITTSPTYAYDFTEPGWYYFWVKDYVGNLSSSDDSVPGKGYAVFVDKFTLKLAKDDVYGHNASSYLHYSFSPQSAINFPASEIDTRRDNLKYTVSFMANGASRLVDWGNTDTTSELLNGNRITTTRYFNGWHTENNTESPNIGITQTHATVKPLRNNPESFETNDYNISGNNGNANIVSSDRSTTLYPRWNDATLNLPDCKRNEDKKEVNGTDEDRFIGWFTNPQPEDGKSGDGGYYAGTAGDKVIVTSDTVLYPWFNIAPTIIHGDLQDGFWEGQPVTYGQLLSLVHAYDKDNPAEVDLTNEENSDVAHKSGRIDWNGTKHWMDLYDITAREWLYDNLPHDTEAERAVIDSKANTILNTINYNEFTPWIESIKYFCDGLDSDGKPYSDSVERVQDINGDESANLLTDKEYVGHIQVTYKITDNGTFSNGVQRPGSPITVTYVMDSVIRFNCVPHMTMTSTYIYTEDENLTADNIAEFLIKKQSIDDVEDDVDNKPWWEKDVTHPALVDSIHVVRVTGVRVAQAYKDEHPTEAAEVEAITNLQELFRLKDNKKEIFNHITNFSVIFDGKDQWGKHASLMPYGLTDKERSIVVIMFNNKDDYDLVMANAVVDERMRYIDKSWISSLTSHTYWADENYGLSILQNTFQKYVERNGLVPDIYTGSIEVNNDTVDLTVQDYSDK